MTKPNKRIACIYVHHLPLQVEHRLDPTLAHQPVIVSGLAWQPEQVFDASETAIGVKVGVSVCQAKQSCPHARVIPPREELYYAQHDTILRVLEQFSPTNESAGLGYFYADVSNMERLYPTEDAMAAAMLGSIQANTNLVARLGIAGNKYTAEQAARHSVDGNGQIVSPGRERDFLVPLSISALPPGTDPLNCCAACICLAWTRSARLPHFRLVRCVAPVWGQGAGGT